MRAVPHNGTDQRADPAGVNPLHLPGAGPTGESALNSTGFNPASKDRHDAIDCSGKGAIDAGLARERRGWPIPDRQLHPCSRPAATIPPSIHATASTRELESDSVKCNEVPCEAERFDCLCRQRDMRGWEGSIRQNR